MKYEQFKEKLQRYPYVTSAIYHSLAKSEKTLYNQVNKWVKNGKVMRLRKGLFTLSDTDRKTGLSKMLAANVIYSPSYVSLEFALADYGMIPEAVFGVTSVTTKKTQRFTNELGIFSYNNIKESAFTGFVSVKDEFGYNCLIATPEKALLDYLYFKAGARAKFDGSFFEESLRLQNTEQLDTKEMERLAKEMKSKKLLFMVERFIKWKEVYERQYQELG